MSPKGGYEIRLTPVAEDPEPSRMAKPSNSSKNMIRVSQKTKVDGPKKFTVANNEQGPAMPQILRAITINDSFEPSSSDTDKEGWELVKAKEISKHVE